uniref:Uncharacterized protein n=1 Tax=Kuenenia stuttgartiensis TaxID=174633 RepID=Q1Q0S5_KUEST|nr:unknown protein [Candidatus Kuenenia stuttgartiensis]
MEIIFFLSLPHHTFLSPLYLRFHKSYQYIILSLLCLRDIHLPLQVAPQIIPRTVPVLYPLKPGN